MHFVLPGIVIASIFFLVGICCGRWLERWGRASPWSDDEIPEVLQRQFLGKILYPFAKVSEWSRGSTLYDFNGRENGGLHCRNTFPNPDAIEPDAIEKDSAIGDRLESIPKAPQTPIQSTCLFPNPLTLDALRQPPESKNESKKLECALQGFAPQLSDIFAFAGTCFITMRITSFEDWSYDFVSPQCQELFGYTSTELLEAPELWWSGISDHDRRTILAQRWDAIKHGRSHGCAYQFRQKEGKIRWIYSVIASRWNPAEQCWWVTALETDVSHQKQVETQQQQTSKALKDHEEQLRQIVDNIQDVFYLKAMPSGELLYVNPMYETIFQRSPQQLIADPASWIEAIHPDDRDRVLAGVQKEFDDHYFAELEYRVCLPDGAIRWVWDRAFPIMNEQGEIYRLAGVNRDITLQKETEISLKTSLQEKEVLLAEIHHRVKNNLQLISSLLSLQTNRVQDVDSKIALQDTYHRVQAIAQIHQSMYSSSNLEKIKFSSYAQRITRNLINSFANRHQQIELVVKISPDIFIRLSKAVPCALILNEAVINAIKHGIGSELFGYIEINLSTQLNETNQNQYFHLSIANDGHPLPDNFSLAKPTSMGLRLIMSLVDQLQGEICVQRSPLTSFIITFPR